MDLDNLKEAQVTYTYNKVGSYKARLQVQDPYGETNVFVRNVLVNSVLNVDFEISNSAIHKGDEVVFTPRSAHAKSFYWNFGNGIRKASGPEPVKMAYSATGRYEISLSVFDEKENENKVTKYIFVGDANKPVASYEVEVGGRKLYPQYDLCGKDKISIRASRRDAVQFSANPSINVDGSHHMLDYTWDFGDGEFANTKIAAHRYGALSQENTCFEVKLTVKDRVSSKTSATESLWVKIENLNPYLQRLLIEDGGVKEKITPYLVRINAQGAYDPDGLVKKYRWWYRKITDSPDQKRGLVQTQEPYANITVIADGLAGLTNEYIFVLEMTDNEDGVVNSEEILGEATVLSIVNGNVDAPVVDFTMDRNQIYVGDTINFFAKAQNLQGEYLNNLTYEWDFNGDGIIDESTRERQVARQFDLPGDFKTMLRVKHQGLSISKAYPVYVDSISRYPLAAFTYQVTGRNFFGDANVSRYDPALKDPTLRFAWDFNKFVDADGDADPANDNESSELKPQYTYPADGEYTVVLKVTDSLGSTDQVERKIKIGDGTTAVINPTTSAKDGGKSSVRIYSQVNAITSLQLKLDKNTVNVEDTTTVSAIVLNADSSPYQGEVEFMIVQGGATLKPDLVQAVNGLAQTKIQAQKEGIVIIRVLAKQTIHETLEERISLKVLAKPNTQVKIPETTLTQEKVNQGR
ncbi:MAG TPA: PKD domain-containing protein, partial [Candidatus Gracilibacteria bacterium]|nr:PKD domain-containing protein [Candidatus Gracilibacteria bacterium]